MTPNQLARVAGLVGEPARAGMLLALMDGRALTAHELATVANVTPATASRHLSLLVEGGLLRMEQQGRHRYHRLASADVARVVESLMQLSARTQPVPRIATGPRDPDMRLARTCYDHLAGVIAVAIADRLVDDRAVVVEDDTAVVTDRAPRSLAKLGLDLGAIEAPDGGKRPACRPCLDWGERRMHLAGRLGALLCSHCLQRGWLLQKPGSRTLKLTLAGSVAFRDWLGNERWGRVTRSS
ncbi:ArsR/SmtB family transcription factor [Ramlibacter algicola]|uniref:Helix-turn-helix transcriptional regulator n=1 Tax=Ramlibacter algicola TaxID=2795217 RepID=A0A934PYA2_9BURK|nr:helix-turn-helix transcriptional regulator [Ramlibacter algicola]MBK0392765.1 helix-turn-helix transcriptional regulator [Ramlibacter algicola]